VLLTEREVDALQRLALDPGWATRTGRELDADDERIVLDVGDALKLYRLDQLATEFGVFQHREADLLDRLADVLEVDIGIDAQVELHGRPVAAEIGDRLELPVGDRVHLPVLVAQAQRAQRDLLHRALEPTGIDVFPHAERVVAEEEDARQDVADQGLAAERDGEAEDAGAGE
jgi:hypothetical protein